MHAECSERLALRYSCQTKNIQFPAVDVDKDFLTPLGGYLMMLLHNFLKKRYHKLKLLHRLIHLKLKYVSEIVI